MGRLREISFTLGYSQYRNAVASGRVRETDPTLPRCGTDCIQEEFEYRVLYSNYLSDAVDNSSQ